MWAYNVARQLSLAAGYAVLPELTPKVQEKALEVAEAYLQNPPARTYCILKVHFPLLRNERIKVIYIERDIRDYIYSFHRFEARALTEESVAMLIKSRISFSEHYAGWPVSHILRLDFNDIEQAPLEVIEQIAEFMSLVQVSDEEIEAIGESLNKDRVRKKISALERAAQETAAHDEGQAVSTVQGNFGRPRIFDDRTGFQSGHVSDYQSGDWQRLWSAEEQALVDRVIRASQL